MAVQEKERTVRGVEALRENRMMARLLDSLDAGKDVGHYGRLVFAMIAPVYERVFELTNLTQGKVNRAIAIQDIASGCSITAARAACQLGATVNLVTTAGGHTGLGLRRLLADEPFMTNVVQVQAETRNVITLLTQDSTGTTVVVEPSRAMSVQDIQSFHRAVSDCSADSCYVLLGGSLPPDVPADSYASLVAALQSAGRIVAVDTRGNAFEPCVRAGARIRDSRRVQPGPRPALCNSPVRCRRQRDRCRIPQRPAGPFRCPSRAAGFPPHQRRERQARHGRAADS